MGMAAGGIIPCGMGGMTCVAVGCKFCGGSVGQPPLERSSSS
jgi:hypothetical protein